MKIIKWVIAALAIVLVVILYMSFIGTSVKLDDFNDPEDTNDDGTSEPPPTAYATFSASGAYGGTEALPTATISTFKALVRDYYTIQEGAVYVDETWGSLFTLPDIDYDLIGYMKTKFVITGMGLSEEWVSGGIPIMSLNGVLGGTWEIPQTGRCFFQDQGTYTVTLSLDFTFLDGGSQIVLATKTLTFEVNV